MYNNNMSEHTDDLPPIEPDKLFLEFSDYSISELILEIKELRDLLAKEKKAHAVDENGRAKAEEQVEILTDRINTAITTLSNESVSIEDD